MPETIIPAASPAAGSKKWWILLAIGVGTFMAALDGSVVNTVLPVIQKEFTADVAAVEWVATIYLLVLSGLLLQFGRLGDMRGHKLTYLAGFVVFVTASALCGSAVQTQSLILFRGIQAFGGAMLASNSPAILTAAFPASERGKALGLSAMMTYLGLTVGPSLGGWLAHAFSWRLVFYINIPVGILGIALSAIIIPHDHASDHSQKFDIPGALTFLAGLIALLLGLNRGAEWGWGSPAVILLLVGAVVFLAIFIRLEKRSPAPMLDLGLFRHPLFSAATGSAVLNYICIYTLLFLTPFFLIQGRGLETSQAGLLLTAQPIVMAIAAPISGNLSDRFGSRLPAMFGMAFLSAGLFVLSRLDFSSSIGWVVLGLALCGLGTGIFISPNNSALMGSAPKHRQGVASGILATARSVGMVLGIGMAGAVLTSHMAADPQAGFQAGIRNGYLVAAGIALLGFILGMIRERSSPGNRL